MILGFSTKINNKPTFFVEKILKSLLDLSENTNNLILKSHVGNCIYNSGEHLKYAYADDILNKVDNSIPKLHSFRNDKNNRWKVGMIIDFYINVRTKSMFQFAPKLAVKSIQKISILWSGGDINTCTIWIDENCYVANYSVDYNQSEQRQKKMELLSQNDGFDSVQDFLDYFSENFYGKIIHWTDLIY